MPLDLNLRLTLFGTPLFQRGETTAKLSRKTAALLAFLAATGKAHSRRALADLFCQETNDPAGTLRWHLSRIRRELSPDLLLEAADSISFNPAAAWVDLHHFQQGIADENDRAQAVSLYQGDFLAGMDLKDAPEWEIWLLGERSRLRRQYERALDALLNAAITAERYDAAMDYARRLLQSDPLLEVVQARLIWLYAVSGRRQEALAQYALCVDLLQNELAVDPTPELTALRDQIVAGELGAVQARPIQLPAASRPAEDSLVLLERQVELDRLNLARARGDHIVLVAAEAGGGKSTLVHHFGQTAGARFLVGRCYESTRSLPYRPWIDLLQQRLAHLTAAQVQALPDFVAEQVGRLLPALSARRTSILVDEASRQEQLFAAIADFLLAEAGEDLLLFVDDLQWADAVSLQLFHFLGERLAQQAANALLIGAYRPEESEENPPLYTLIHDLQRTGALLTLTPPPLSAQAVDQLIQRRWTDLPPGYRTPYVRDMLLAETGGNPLFVTELLQELSQAEELPESMPVPPSLRTLIGRRLRQLPESGRQVIEALAVLDQPSTFDLLLETSGRSDEEGETALELGLRWRLLQAGDDPLRVDFQHALMREAVLAEMTTIRRRRLHRRAALQLAQIDTPAATLTYHWRMAGDRVKEGEYAVRAGMAAAAIYAHDDAIGYFTRALACLPNGEEQIRAQIELGNVLVFVGRWDEADAIFGEANQAAADRRASSLQATALTALGGMKVSRGLYVEARTWLEQAEAVLGAAQETTLRMEIARNLGLCAWRLGDYAAAQDYFQRQLDLSTSGGDKAQVSDAYRGLGLVHWSWREFQRALEDFEDSLRLARAAGHLRNESRALGNIGLIHAEWGQYDLAIDYYNQSLRIQIELRDQLSLLRNLGNIGRLYYVLGHVESAGHYLRHQLRLATQLGDWQGASVALGNLGNNLSLVDETVFAEALVTRAIALGRRLNIPSYLCDYLGILAVVRVDQQRFAEAAVLAVEAETLAAASGREDVRALAYLVRVEAEAKADPAQRDERLAELSALRATLEEGAQRADVSYTIWRIDPTNRAARDQATAFYTQFVQEKAGVLYRARFEELTGQPAPPLPPLKDDIPTLIAHAVDLDECLRRVDAFLAGE